ncbi:DUF3568 family protein [Paludisphaera rhizosphaerae]|uniref:DUF3568 family protein n=1 Tax=Paludisphaera rhizosphaerae TaxID=2711216 RepID=UPI0013EC2E25|nr:DUF3568 family protein [Paludisphaera rhizosphaerae]
MIRRVVGRCSLAGLLLATAGCAVTSPRVVPASTPEEPGFSFSAGQGSQSFSASQVAVATAAGEALGDLGLHDVNVRRDGTVVRCEAVTSDNRSASVTIRSLGGSSAASARVGWFGDEALSRAILERIAVRLGELPPQPVSQSPPSTPGSNPFFSRSAVPDAVMLRDQADAPYTDRVIP